MGRFLPSEASPGESPCCSLWSPRPQVQQEREELYRKFTAAIQEVQQKTGFKNLLLERKLQALNAAVEKREVQFNEVLAASNLDPTALTLVSRKLEVGADGLLSKCLPSRAGPSVLCYTMLSPVAQRPPEVRGCHGFCSRERGVGCALQPASSGSVPTAPLSLFRQECTV